jgi:hypothetical protein
MRLICVLCVLILGSCGFFSRKPEKTPLTEGVHYFSSFSGLKMGIPIPDGPISESDAKYSDHFVRVTVDSMGRIRTFEKFLKQEFFFSFKYDYYDGGQLRYRQAINAVGDTVKSEYTTDGAPIK